MGSPGMVRSHGMLDVAGRYFLAQTGRSARMDGWQDDAVHIHDSLRARQWMGLLRVGNKCNSRI